MNHIPSLATIGAFLIAIALSAAGTWLILRGRLAFALDRPDQRRKLHQQPTPRIGGLPIYLTLMAGFAAAEWRFPGHSLRWWPVILTNSLIFLIGFIDDIRPLGARVKFIGQIGSACVLYALGVSIDELSNPFRGGAVFDLGAWSFPVTVVWLVAIPNLVNLIDGMDGLASGFGLFLSLTLAFVGHYNSLPEIVFISAVMSGALAGFLIFNFPPARIFLGDGGAYLIGFFIASASLVSSIKGSVMAVLLVIVVAMGVPIFDTLLAIARRSMRGVPIFRADAEHIHHRLVLMGFSKARALVALYSVSLVLSLLGIAILLRRGLALPIAGGVLFLMTLFSIRYLGYIKSWRQLRRQIDEAMLRRRDMLFSGVCGRMAEWEAERCSTAEEFMAELTHAMARCGLRLSAGEGSQDLALQLFNGAVCHLYCPEHEPGARDRWLAKADLFVPAINRAIERWMALPGLKIVANHNSRPPQAAPSSPSHA